MSKFKLNNSSFITMTYICDICNNYHDIQISKGVKKKSEENINLWCYKCQKFTNHKPVKYEEKIKVFKL